ncbi:hypothetical protein HZS_734 [Henneguya salminicola]|nr:hypothetical protein HZS_734 [Henneguya salminicola]
MDDDPLNYYSILNLSPDCEQEDIRKAYLYWSRIFHPDKHHSEDKKNDSKEFFLKINKAYEVLSDPVSRETYHIRSLILNNKDHFKFHTQKNLSDDDILMMCCNFKEKSVINSEIDVSNLLNFIIGGKKLYCFHFLLRHEPILLGTLSTNCVYKVLS